MKNLLSGSCFQKTIFTSILTLFLLILLLTPALAILANGEIKIFAVTEDHKGMAADLFMYTISGSGRAAFITSNSLVGKDTQTTGNIALELAQKMTKTNIIDKDIMFDIRANASEVDGPSAGAAMTLLSYSMLSEKKLNPVVALTGTINSDGSIGMVGGVGPKAVAASKVGIKLFLIPSGEAVADIEDNSSMKTVNLLEYGPKTLGMKIAEVSTISQAIEYAYSNIESIQVDSNVDMQIFIPKPISYSSALFPMKKISQNYITDAKAVIEGAKTELEKSDMPDELRADLYQRHSATKRSVEMAQRFFDQNYLYSAANYAFNARVMAGTIKEIAENPSLLGADKTVLNSKISELRANIALVKETAGFTSLDSFEWMIGAQQRIAYAENALNGLDSAEPIPLNENAPTNDEKLILREIYFNRVYEYVSAQAWISVSQDFIKQAQKSTLKKIPVYSNDFLQTVESAITNADSLIKDSNASKSAVDESQRRLKSAKISYDNNFYFAALYDSYFAQAFILGELNRKFLDQNTLFSETGKSINSELLSDSIWANLFFDHAKFYYENAIFNEKIGRTQDVAQNTMTSYDLIFLSNKIAEAKTIVGEYILSTSMNEYKIVEPVVEIKYTTKEDPLQKVIVFIMLFGIVFIGLMLILGLVIKSRKGRLGYDERKSKLHVALENLEKALVSNIISDAEYFFMKKKYDEELTKNFSGARTEHKRLRFTVDELKAKQRALERGLIDLRRHFNAGVIIPEDFEKNREQVREEINEIKNEIQLLTVAQVGKKKKGLGIGNLLRKIAGKKDAIKGTEELASVEERSIAKERAKRREVLKKFAYSKEKNKK